MDQTPRAEYESRLAARRASAQRTARRVERLAQLRLAVFALTAAVAWISLTSPGLPALAIAAPLALFVALVFAHGRTKRDLERTLRAVAYYERSLARLDYDFAGSGRSGEEFLATDHPYAGHLDLFGQGSLFELLCGAQTGAGVATLARWLLDPAAPAAIRARQAAVAELRPRLDLREDLAVLGREASAQLEPERLIEWGRAPATSVVLPVRVLAAALALGALASAAAIPLVGVLPLATVAALEAAFALRFRSSVRAVRHAVDRALHNLELLLELLRRIEREPFQSPALCELRRALETRGAPPSREIAGLRQLVELLRQSRNQFFALIAPFLLWSTQLSFAIERWRARCGPELGGWLGALGQLEALCDLAGYAYEHPEDCFPELVESESCFQAQQLGHPLIPDEHCVRNDLRLDPGRALYVVSGSNMSGKTTLLRTVGVNAVLAQCGAPVRAQSLRLSPLRVGASIVVHDSLREGASRFYAEITCLSRIVALTRGEATVLFLLDEILGGTNSHDRSVGAAAVVRGLVERGALGLLTTHDLALSRIAEELAPRAANVHFEDQLRDGRICFDYRLREGVVSHSNALALMRAVGLPV